VVEGTGLENRQAGNRLVGSNPTPSANHVGCETSPAHLSSSVLLAVLALRFSPPMDAAGASGHGKRRQRWNLGRSLEFRCHAKQSSFRMAPN
jgi:hypothetical protein